jgi:dTDP-D-glucose 4,6-dehydratase
MEMVKISCTHYLRYFNRKLCYNFVYCVQKAWFGEKLPIIGDGNNIIPIIHVEDLAKIVREIAITKPQEDRYFLAVDSSNSTLSEIVKVCL